MKSGKVARVYSVNQKRVDEGCQAYADLIAQLASKDKLRMIAKQLADKAEITAEATNDRDK